MTNPAPHLKAYVDTHFPHMETPEIQSYRPFHEGVIAYRETNGNRSKATHSYKKDGFHIRDWNAGWERAQEYMRRKSKFKFMGCVV